MNGELTQEQTGTSSRMIQMEAIVAEHETALLRYATRLVNNPFAAQDIVQNVFIKLFKAWKEGTRPSGRMKGWLYRVTHNEAVDHIRRESRLKNLHEKHTERRTEECPDGHNCPGPDDERRDLVLSHLRNLMPKEQQVLLLRLEEGMSYREISRVTGRSTGAVASLLHGAVLKLGRSLKGTP